MKNLIIVDMQKGQINENNQFLVEGINSYLQKEKFDNVIYTRFYNHLDSQYVYLLDYREMLTTEEQEFCVDVVEESVVFPKCSYGIPWEQINYLKQKHIEEIILCGTDIDACVLAIAYNLFDNGIMPRFKWDLCGSKNPDRNAKENAKKIIINLFGEEAII